MQRAAETAKAQRDIEDILQKKDTDLSTLQALLGEARAKGLADVTRLQQETQQVAERNAAELSKLRQRRIGK